MNRARRIGVLALLAVAALAPALASAASTLYRYRTAENVVVIDFSIPPEFAVKGYEVITPDGRVLETVPAVSDKPSRDQQAQRRQQQRQDQFILRSYTTVRDVYNARDRRLTLLTREIDILKSNLAEYRRRHRELRQQAASYQASGKPPPKATEEVLNELREQEASAMKLLAERRAQHKALSDNYAYYAARLVELKGDSALAGLDVAPRPEGAGEGKAEASTP